MQRSNYKSDKQKEGNKNFENYVGGIYVKKHEINVMWTYLLQAPVSQLQRGKVNALKLRATYLTPHNSEAKARRTKTRITFSPHFWLYYHFHMTLSWTQQWSCSYRDERVDSVNFRGSRYHIVSLATIAQRVLPFGHGFTTKIGRLESRKINTTTRIHERRTGKLRDASHGARHRIQRKIISQRRA